MAALRWTIAVVACLALLVPRPALALTPDERTRLEAEVRAAEDAFAKTLADRDLAAFARFVADDAAFFGRDDVSRGKPAVVQSWSGFFEGSTPPFSWRSELAVVLDSGTLAHSSGPVFGPDGERFGTFNSIWRREPSGEWKVVFDKGCAYCEGK
ncbi:MAG TPA: nuclear transport factor 2 family protein [Candidatus Polarisedimenticolaceae bacterium]|nr:nuclear transport factor 2 family protein [Candidatus Polarisedimenticolaceae bacterium]